jgi:hypothetical protein
MPVKLMAIPTSTMMRRPLTLEVMDRLKRARTKPRTVIAIPASLLSQKSVNEVVGFFV